MNCWRTPPIAFPVAPPAISPTSASTTSSAPRSARWYAIEAPIAPAPATTTRATRAAPRARRSVSARSGARTSSRIGTPRAPSTNFSAAWRGKRSTAARSSPSAAAARSSARARLPRPARGTPRARPETAPAAPAASPSTISASGADEDVEPFEQVRREPLERRVGDLQPGEVRRPLAQLVQHRRAARRSRSRARTRRRRTAAARTRRPPRRSGRAAPGRRAGSTAARSRRPRRRPPRRRAPRARRCRAVVCAPQCAATCSRPPSAATKSSTTRRRSSTPRAGSLRRSCRARAGRRARRRRGSRRTGANALLVEPVRPSSGVTAAASAPRSMCDSTAGLRSSTLVSRSYEAVASRAVSNPRAAVERRRGRRRGRPRSPSQALRGACRGRGAPDIRSMPRAAGEHVARPAPPSEQVVAGLAEHRVLARRSRTQRRRRLRRAARSSPSAAGEDVLPAAGRRSRRGPACPSSWSGAGRAHDRAAGAAAPFGAADAPPTASERCDQGGGLDEHGVLSAVIDPSARILPPMGALRIERDGDLLRVTLARPETAERLRRRADRASSRRRSSTSARRGRSCSPATGRASAPAPTSSGCARPSISTTTRTWPTRTRCAACSRRSTAAPRRSSRASRATRSAAAPGSSRARTSPSPTRTPSSRSRRSSSGSSRPSSRPFALAKIGPSAARRYFVTGERFDAATALRIGLVHEVAADLDAAVERVLAELWSAGPRAARHAKRLVLERPDGPETARRIAERRTSDEGQEGLKAFLERRSPTGG